MRITSLTLIAILVLATAGCSNKEEELQATIDDLVQKNLNLTNDVVARDQYIADMVSSVNAVYSGLEIARQEEATLLRRVSAEESNEIVNNPDVRQQVIRRVSELGNTIEGSKKKVASLQTQLASTKKRYTGLEEMVAGLQKNVEEREQSVAELKARVEELTGQVETAQREAAEKESLLMAKSVELKTVYYIVGTRSELEEKGIIQDVGGFPWGLFGSTTILSSGLDESHFTPVDMTTTNEFQVDGEIDEIIPMRDEMFYQLEPGTGQTSIATPAEEEMTEQMQKTLVRVTDGRQFWQSRYLVIIKD
ncbi:MAG: hypothetical protein L0Y80_10150 [Ignavibacteriae bacterium]|nr:hypothetical protein [Ignavibacteriota bacterium]